MKSLRVLLALWVLLLAPATVSAQGYFCTPWFTGCPGCAYSSGYVGFWWPTSCGDSCVCRLWTITSYREVVYEPGDPPGPCTMVCDWGTDGSCDCSGWVLQFGLGRDFLI